MATPKPVNRSTKDADPFAEATPLQLQALGMGPIPPTANRREVQKKALKKLRLKQLEKFRNAYSDMVGRPVTANQAAEVFADFLGQQDAAFRRGYYKQSAKMSRPTANAQQLDWEEWEERDDTDITEARVVTNMTADLEAAGLAADTSLARMIYRWAIRSEAFEADRSIDGRNRGTSDGAEKAFEGVSMPITHIDWELSWREIQNSQNFGEPVDDTDAEEAGESLAVAQEELMADGWDVEVPIDGIGTFSVDGYRTTDYRITDDATGSWDEPENVLDTLDLMQQVLHGQTDDENRGADVESTGAWVYYPRAQWSNVTLQEEPRGQGDRTIRERIEQDYPWLELRQSGVLEPDEVLMVVQDRNFVELVNAQAPTNMSWDVEGGMGTRYKTLNCQVPAIKGTFGPDAESKDDAIVGVAHFSGIA
ncbi:major capsid protein [Natrarchaeobaculum sulfurireducens]|uniref:Major capsid protein n=1 Tax=Natrarchaeobaculum sulfurireducens TaxID=2044521 RepID=A0A346PMP7_9EURY|nr:major capsid protein [Natrarchaeobaculum sulfurireducens]AXR80792.1 hypothetical protein AArcMg_0770 [Natrarchaeobaculum sulfurireducens]